MHKDVWREDGSYVDKGPFPQPKTSVLIQEQTRDDDTGEVVLRLTPVNGDKIYWEIGSAATTASAQLDGPTLRTQELKISFLSIDSTGVHETGQPILWRNRITLKHKIFQQRTEKSMELRAAPLATIHYTTDGSDPKLAGAVYEGPFIIPKGSPMVLAYAEHEDILSEVERISINWERDETIQVDPKHPALWRRRHGFNSTRESYEFLARLKKYEAKVQGLTVTIASETGNKEWIELTTSEGKKIEPGLIDECLEALRQLQSSGQVHLIAEGILFRTGQALLDWVEEVRTTLQPGEVKQ